MIDKTIPDEEKEEVKTKLKKMNIPDQDNSLMIDQDDRDSKREELINIWIQNLQEVSQKNKNVVGTFANGYKNEGFFKVLINSAKEFPLWSAVMIKSFNVTVVRVSISAVEGSFNELKNRILWNYERKILLHKFFITHFKAITAITLKASTELLNFSLEKK